SPGGSTTTTAEHTVAMLFALARNIPQAYRTLKNHQWEKNKFKGVELAGKTLGVIGLGRIGSEVARKCQAMGMKIIAFDPYINPDAHLSGGFQLVDVQNVFEEADFITVHVPLTDATRNLGASTVEAQRKVSEDICRQVSDFLVKNTVDGALNFPRLEAGTIERYQHFVDLAARLATFIAQICSGRMQTVSIRYSGEV